MTDDDVQREGPWAADIKDRKIKLGGSLWETSDNN